MKLIFSLIFCFALVAQAEIPAKQKRTLHSTTETVTEPSGESSVETSTTETVEPADGQDHLGEKAKAEAHKAEQAVQNAVGLAGDRRESSTVSVMGEFSPIDLILPAKLGGAIGYISSRQTTYEVEYLGRSLSAPSFLSHIGGFDDRRVSLLVRSYSDRNSFNVHYGVSYFDMGIHIDHSYLVSSSTASDFDNLMRARTLGLIVGIGNRWVFPHGFELGVDWISWAQPLVVLQADSSIIDSVQNQDAKSTLEDTFRLAIYFPRFTLLKVAAGLTF